MLYNIIISPIENLIETIFYFAFEFINSFGIICPILCVSLAVNFLALPLYNIADDIQDRERALQKRLAFRTARIKDAFRGDERFMILSTYYRQNGYHPLYSLRASLSILIEIPFFIAAYHFLSHCQVLEGASFWIFNDLGSPDGLIPTPFVIKGVPFSINILPVLMTIINVVSATVYLKGTVLREKLQTFSLALIFLVLLYNSPAGLVIYWILNNLFSLGKNIIKKYVKKPAGVVHIIISTVAMALALYLLILRPNLNLAKRLIVFAVALAVSCTPFAIRAFHVFFDFPKIQIHETKYFFPVFIYSCLGMALLTGFVLPSNVISTSPSEFCFIGNTGSPVKYVWSAFTLGLGLLVFWPVVIWKLFKGKIHIVMTTAFSTAFICAILNAFVFRYDYGHLSVFFQLDDSGVLRNSSPFFTILPVVVIFILVPVFTIVLRKEKLVKFISGVLMAVCIAEASFAGIKLVSIKKAYEICREEKEKEELLADSASLEIEPVYHFSKTGKNVVVFFIDRAISSFVPYIVQQFPSLKEDYSGFTFYPNTVTFGGATWCGSPAMMGGYEYTEPEKKKRPAKENEEIIALTKNFIDADYSVTVTDPPYVVDLESLKNTEGINALALYNKYTDRFVSEHPEADVQNQDEITRKRIFKFCLMEVIYPLFRFTYYDRAAYFSQAVMPVLDTKFLGFFSSLYYMDKLTAADNSKNTFTFIGNDSAHEYSILREPDFMPDTRINPGKATSGGYKYKVSFYDNNASDLAGYHVNAAVYLQIAKWLRHLKKIGVYDNTRIIIVSDHGREMPVPAFEGLRSEKFYALMNPVLLYKDFNSEGDLKSDDEFMTNADTIILAHSNLDVAQTNPVTGKRFADSVAKTPAEVYPSISLESFKLHYADDPEMWTGEAPDYVPNYTVSGNIFKPENWSPVRQ